MDLQESERKECREFIESVEDSDSKPTPRVEVTVRTHLPGQIYSSTPVRLKVSFLAATSSLDMVIFDLFAELPTHEQFYSKFRTGEYTSSASKISAAELSTLKASVPKQGNWGNREKVGEDDNTSSNTKSAIKAAPFNQPAMKYQEESFKAGTASEKPATPKPAMNQILLGYAEAVKMRKNGKVAPKKKAAEEEAAKIPLSSTQKHLGAEGTEKEKASDSQDNLSNQTVKERDKEKIDKKGKGKATLQIEEHQGQITKCGKKRVLETVKTSDDMHEGKIPSKKAKRDLSSLGDVSSARPGVRKVTSGTSQPSGGVGDAKQNSRGGNSGADGGESSRLGRHASESFRGSRSGGGGKKRKATGDGDSEEDEDDKPRRNKPNSKPSGRKTKKARKRSDKDLNDSSDEDDTDGKLKDSRSSASGRLPTARPREARKVMKTRDSDRQPSSSGSGGDSGSSWASQSGRYWTNEKFPEDDDAENGEEDTHTHTTGPLSGSSVLAGAELIFQLDELEKARELRQRIRESNHPELAYDIGLTPALISDLSHNRGQHSKLSLKDTPEWVARHLFGDRYNHETDRKYSNLQNSCVLRTNLFREFDRRLL